jgi:hypothetical protein
VNRECPAMAHQRLKLATLPAAMVEALQLTVSLKPQDESQRIAQREMVSALHRAADDPPSAHYPQSINGRPGEMGCNLATGTLRAHCYCYGP